MGESKGIGKGPTRRGRTHSSPAEAAEGPNRVRIYVVIPLELRRKIGALCELNGRTISEVVHDYLADLARTHVLAQRSNGQPFPGTSGIRLAETETTEREPGAMTG